MLSTTKDSKTTAANTANTETTAAASSSSENTIIIANEILAESEIKSRLRIMRCLALAKVDLSPICEEIGKKDPAFALEYIVRFLPKIDLKLVDKFCKSPEFKSQKLLYQHFDNDNLLIFSLKNDKQEIVDYILNNHENFKLFLENQLYQSILAAANKKNYAFLRKLLVLRMGTLESYSLSDANGQTALSLLLNEEKENILDIFKSLCERCRMSWNFRNSNGQYDTILNLAIKKKKFNDVVPFLIESKACKNLTELQSSQAFELLLKEDKVEFAKQLYYRVPFEFDQKMINIMNEKNPDLYLSLKDGYIKQETLTDHQYVSVCHYINIYRDDYDPGKIVEILCSLQKIMIFCNRLFEMKSWEQIDCLLSKLISCVSQCKHPKATPQAKYSTIQFIANEMLKKAGDCKVVEGIRRDLDDPKVKYFFNESTLAWVKESLSPVYYSILKSVNEKLEELKQAATQDVTASAASSLPK